MNDVLKSTQLPAAAVGNVYNFRSVDQFYFEQYIEEDFLAGHGLKEFDDFWQLPRTYIDDVNYRRGGWGAVSKLTLADGSSQKTYYVKRQENQFRYSLGRPLGALTYEHEVFAVLRNKSLHLAANNLVCWGVRRGADTTRGLIVSREIPAPSLSDIIASRPDWQALEPVLHRCGSQLLLMHQSAIQHGALYPKHIFLDLMSGDTQLIDFERARRRGSVRNAIKSDIKQLIKRLDGMPSRARSALLSAYIPDHTGLINELLSSRIH